MRGPVGPWGPTTYDVGNRLFWQPLATSSDYSRVWFPALQSLCGNSKIGPRIGPRPGGPVAKRYGPGTWLTLLGFRFCPKARGNAGKVNKDETTIRFHLSFEISPNARDSNIPTATAASILAPFARKKDWGTSSTVNHVPGPKCQPCARSVHKLSPSRQGWGLDSPTLSERRR